MIAAYPAVNLEPSCYTALHQQSNDDNPITQDSSSPSSASDFPYSVAMAYSQCEANNHLSPPFRQLGEDKDRKQCVRLPSTEDTERKVLTCPNKNVINEGLMNSVLTLHSNAPRFTFDQHFPSEIVQRSPNIQRVLPSPSENSQNFPEYNSSPIKTPSSHRRSTSDEQLTSGSKKRHDSNTVFEDEEDSTWKVCGVCNDKATGYHFNAMTCEGCKGFFRRSMKSGKVFTCTYNNDCPITKSSRRQCQACRLRKCIAIGMKRECIMSDDQIQQKKSLVITNRIKRSAHVWTPLELAQDQHLLLDIITNAFRETNVTPDTNEIRGADAIERDVKPSSPCPSPTSSNSSTNYIDMINKLMSNNYGAQPSARSKSPSTDEAHVLHFTDIMEFSIKQVIKFCKKIPTFMDLEMKDQISLLKSGCTEVLFIKANYTYDIERKALTLGPKILYTRESFLQGLPSVGPPQSLVSSSPKSRMGGMSDEYTDSYLKFHEDLKILQLDDTEMAALSAIALFSADRSEVSVPPQIEDQQQRIAFALNAYSDTYYRRRNRFATIMAFLPRLRRLNALCTHAFSKVQKQYEHEIKPLVIETQPDTDPDTDS